MEYHHVAAASGNGSFWPHGVVMITAITAICALIGVWRIRKEKREAEDRGHSRRPGRPSAADPPKAPGT